MAKWIILSILVAFIGTVNADEEVHYYLITGSSSPGESYALPLSSLDDIWELTSHPDWIIFADIAPWDKHEINLNRNYAVPGAPSWSWYVTNFQGCSEVGPEICDGGPLLVEAGLFSGNTTCFWDFHVSDLIGVDIDPWCYVLVPDCTANYLDLEIIVSHWLESGCCYPDWCGGADLDVSGIVDMYDFAILAERWLVSSN